MTVISTLQLILVEAVSTQGHALRTAKVRKRDAHAEACHEVGFQFVSLLRSPWVVGVVKLSISLPTLTDYRDILVFPH